MTQINAQRMTVEVEGDFVVFLKSVGRSRGDVGIWHETYRVAAGQYEAIYSGMPALGLATVGKLMPVSGARDSARERIEAAVLTSAR